MFPRGIFFVRDHLINALIIQLETFGEFVFDAALKYKLQRIFNSPSYFVMGGTLSANEPNPTSPKSNNQKSVKHPSLLPSPGWFYASRTCTSLKGIQ